MHILLAHIRTRLPLLSNMFSRGIVVSLAVVSPQSLQEPRKAFVTFSSWVVCCSCYNKLDGVFLSNLSWRNSLKKKPFALVLGSAGAEHEQTDGQTNCALRDEEILSIEI